MNSNHEWTRMNRRKERKKGQSGLPFEFSSGGSCTDWRTAATRSIHAFCIGVKSRFLFAFIRGSTKLLPI